MMYYNSSIKEDSMYKHLRQVKQDIDQSFEGLLPRETMSVHTIARKLAKRMGAKHGMRFVSVNEPIGKRHADGELFCGGSFYPWYADENDWYDSEVCLNYKTKDINLGRWWVYKTFHQQMTAAILHELNHRQQYLSRGKKERKNEIFKSSHRKKKVAIEENYYGSLDEIQSYAIDVALECHYNDVTPRQVWKHIDGRISRPKYTTLHIYKNMFKDKDHPLMKKLKYYSYMAYNQILKPC